MRKIRKGTSRYFSDRVGRIESSTVLNKNPRTDPDVVACALMAVSLPDMLEMMSGDVHGLPRYVAYDDEELELVFYPIPDADYFVSLWYYSPIKQW